MSPTKTASICIAVLATLNASAEPSTNPDAAVQELVAAQYYALGFTGVGGMQSSGQTALVQIHRMPNRELLFRRAAQTGSPVTKVYIACWASTFDRPLFAEIKRNLLSQYAKTAITTMKGSVLGQSTVADLLVPMEPGQCGEMAISGNP